MTQQQQAQNDNQEWRRTPPHPLRNNPWQFEKKLSINTIIEILGLAVVLGGPMIVWGRAMESRVLTLETVQDERKHIEIETRTNLTQKIDRMSDDVNKLQVQVGILSSQITSMTSMGIGGMNRGR